MAKQPRLRMTNADYVAIAVSPALIMALVGSLVFFLIEVLYVGQYQARINYVFALFVFATVLIGRISIEMGAERAALFGLPLGIAMFLVLAKFVPHASPYSHFINISLLALVWWCVHKLTWDCTLIDDNEDASGEGLMQRIGIDELAESEQGQTHNELLAENEATKTSTPHPPGLWVLYFSLAALPLFGIGQKWIPAGDVGRRQYAFGLLAVYVAAGLTLLVTTSLLGLRRYLRQRRVEMPAPMAATWVATGGVLIGVVMLLAALIPRPQAEFAISQVPWQVESPSDLASSQTSFGNDGTEDDNPDTRQVINEETDPNSTATREGDNPTTTSEEGEKQSSGGEGEEKGQENSAQGESEKGDQAGERESGEAKKQTEGQQPTEPSESGEQTKQASDDGETSEASAESKEDTEKKEEDPKSKSASKLFRSPQSLPNLLPAIGGVAAIIKLVLYAVFAVALGFLAWRSRREIAQAVAEIIQMVRDLWARLFGGGSAKPASVADNEMKKVSGPSSRLFASFADPFASGQHRSMPPDELVRYTFEAFEAWSRERGHPRSPDQTPLELIRQAVPKQTPLFDEAKRLARLYNEAAYAPGSISTQAVTGLEQFWVLLRQPQETTATTGPNSA